LSIRQSSLLSSKPETPGFFPPKCAEYILGSMTSKEPEDWEAAEQAFAAAQGMPVGPERIAALRRAGQMRFDAFQKKQADLELMDRENKLLRRG
jgi:hypothetical protein